MRKNPIISRLIVRFIMLSLAQHQSIIQTIIVDEDEEAGNIML